MAEQDNQIVTRSIRSPTACRHSVKRLVTSLQGRRHSVTMPKSNAQPAKDYRRRRCARLRADRSRIFVRRTARTVDQGSAAR